MRAGNGSRGKGRVPNDGFGIGVAVEGRFIYHTALIEIPETAVTEFGGVAVGQIATELVHRNLQYEARFLDLLRVCRQRTERQTEYEPEYGYQFEVLEHDISF
jgi:hypothetical protein